MYAITVILTLALGLASVGSMFAVVHAVLLAPLPYAAPDRLVGFGLDLPDGSRVAQSPAIYLTYRRFSSQLDDVALYRTGSANVWTQSEDVGAEHLTATWITASGLRLLQVPPLLGRTFSDDEERRGGGDAVVLSESEWRSRFAASADVIGNTLIVNDVPREIIGVMPARFAFPAASTRLWLPAKYSDSATAGDFLYTGLARLAPGATEASAQLELQSLLPKMAELFPRTMSGGSTATWLDDAQPALRVHALRAALTDFIAPMLWMLAALAGLTLLVAWANVANLMLIRIDATRQDVALREALGASPLLASAHMITESVLLGAAAALLALLVSLGALTALQAFGPAELPRLEELATAGWAAAFIVLIALLGTIAGAALLTRLERPGDFGNRLHDGTRGQTSGKPRQRLRSTVTVLQIAAALVVLAGSALLLRTSHQLHEVHPGFEAKQVTTFRILLPFARYDGSDRVAFYARLNERVRQLPSVAAAGLASRLPLAGGQSPAQNFLLAGSSRPQSLPVNVVSDGYFSAMQIPLIAGRTFRSLPSQRPDEMIISQRVARTLLADPQGSASVGKTLTLDPGGPTYTVIGVVGDARYDDLALPPEPMVYRAQVVAADPEKEPGPLPAMVITVRSSAPPDTLVEAVRGIARELDPTVPVFEVRSMSDVVRQSMTRLTLMLMVMTTTASVAVLLAMIGLYGVMAYVVTLRRREIGLRMALGAERRRIAGWVLRRGLLLTSIGIAAGTLICLLLAPTLHASIRGVAAWDPLSLLASITVLASTAALACLAPALRAATVDPARALRSE